MRKRNVIRQNCSLLLCFWMAAKKEKPGQGNTRKESSHSDDAACFLVPFERRDEANNSIKSNSYMYEWYMLQASIRNAIVVLN